MPAASEFTLSYITQWVRRKLGEPTLCVELDDIQIEDAVSDTLELFQKYRPREEYISGSYSRGHHLVDPPEGTLGVLDVDFVRMEHLDYNSLEGSLLYDPFYFLSSGAMSGIDVQLYDLTRHWIEIIGKEFGAEEGYVVLDDYRIFLQVPGEFKVSILWGMPYEDQTNIPVNYHQLFLNLTLAKSQYLLGLIRSKYGGVPGAGGTVQLDGEYHRERGSANEDKYTDELMRISPYYVPTIG